MFNLLHIPEHEIDKAVDRVLTSQRVEHIARRLAEMLLAELVSGLQARDRETEGA